MAVTLVLAMFASTLASAAQVSERSVALSNSSKEATNVTYDVAFTPTSDAGAFVVDFCSNTPVIGQPCTAPVGFTAAATPTTASGFTVTPGVSKLVLAGTLTAATPVSVSLTGVTNPDSAGTIYARVLTYANATTADDYTSIAPGATIDEGGVAMSITSTVGVSGAVLESMIFCIANEAITESCANASGANAPVLVLGETTGNITALDATKVSTGDIYTQISTNAANGAVINLKSGNTVNCGGLVNSSRTDQCYINSATIGGVASGVTVGSATFGVLTSAATGTAGMAGGATATGTLQPVSGSGYNDTTYAFNWVTGNATGVTSTFGDPFIDTDGAPANNQNMKLTFGVSSKNDTPAGNYSTALSLIATGKF